MLLVNAGICLIVAWRLICFALMLGHLHVEKIMGARVIFDLIIKSLASCCADVDDVSPRGLDVIRHAAQMMF